MKVKIKRLSEEAVIPSYSTNESGGMDITATKIIQDSYDCIWYGTDIAIEIPEGYVGLIFPRSSISKTDLELANSIGMIDSDYRGEIQVRFNFRSKYYYNEVIDYEVGDRVAQLMIIPRPKIEFEEVDELSNTNRGDGGFGSTGI